MLNRIQNIYGTYPQQFWLVMGASFIDRIGGAMLFPFFALYLTARFDVSLTQVGVMFMIATISGLFGSAIGGSLTDRFGRKKIILFGLVVSALTSLSLIAIETFEAVYLLGVFVGFFGSIAGPAQQAIIADILPEEQHNEGYGLWRIVANLAVTFGPLIGGFMAGYSYAILFIIDAITSVITAIVLSFLLKESHPTINTTEAQDGSQPATTYGYWSILRDSAFMIFVLINILMVLVYTQMNQTLPVYLRDAHDIPPQGYGYILSMNAAMVVLFQFWVSKRIKHYSPFLVMAAGSALYAIGFGMYGFVSSFAMFMLAMVIITVGEMFTAPTGQTLVAKFAPADKRGRYMAVYGFSWAIPSSVGLIFAGLLMDNYGDNSIWYASGLLGIVVVMGYLALYKPRQVPLIGHYLHRQPEVISTDSLPATG